MARKYTISVRGVEFEIINASGESVGIYKQKRKAQRTMRDFQRDDLVLKVARHLIQKAVVSLMRSRGIDRRAAKDWIREAAQF